MESTRRRTKSKETRELKENLINSKVKSHLKEGYQLKVVEKSKNQIKTECRHPEKQRQAEEKIYVSEKIPMTKADQDFIDSKRTPIRESIDAVIHKYEKEVRKRIEEPHKYPNSVHGVVKSTFGPEKYGFSTGIIIGPNLVLTAAHNLYNNEYQKGKLEFIPAINGKLAPFGSFEVIDSYCPENWEEKNDYAILLIDRFVGLETGYFGLHIAEESLLKDKEWNIIGYPNHIRDENGNLFPLSSEGNHQQWGDKGKLLYFEGDDLINYKIFTSRGQSGSGDFYYDKESDNYYVIGVHVGKKGDLSIGTWITEKRFRQIQEWILDARQKIITNNIQKRQYDGIFELDLDFMDIGPEGAEILAYFQMKNLRKLKLNSTDIGNEGAKALSTATTWINLQTLELQENNITADGAKALSTVTTWTNLQTLDLSFNFIHPEGQKALKERWPNCKICYK